MRNWECDVIFPPQRAATNNYRDFIKSLMHSYFKKSLIRNWQSAMILLTRFNHVSIRNSYKEAVAQN